MADRMCGSKGSRSDSLFIAASFLVTKLLPHQPGGESVMLKRKTMLNTNAVV
jgi:hypothetical protein